MRILKWEETAVTTCRWKRITAPTAWSAPGKLVLAALAGLMLAAPSTADAQETAEQYPSRQITIIVAYPPGGFNDQVARLLAEDFSERFGQTVVVDNRPGGGTVVGTDLLAKASKDGYTLGIAPFAFAINPGLFPNLPYDTEADFAHIATLGGAYNVLAAHPDFPADTVEDLIAYARENPGEVDYSSAGNGSSNHLSGEMFKVLADVDIVHIPYGGSAPARTDLVAGRVDITFDNLTNLQSLVETGELKALGVSTLEESDLMPGVPPISDTVEGYEVTVWWGLTAPAGVPDDIVAKLNEAANEFLSREDTQERFRVQGVEPIGGSVEEAEQYVRNQMEIWLPIAEQAQMQVD